MESSLNAGPTVEVWADGCQEIDGFYVFGVLVDAETDPGGNVMVTNRTPSNPARVVIALARFPIDEVADISSA